MADLRGLIVDWGGVLTNPLRESMALWCQAEGVDELGFRAVMREWLGTPSGDDVATNPAHALERGEMGVPEFERELATRLHTHSGDPVAADGLLSRMFAGFEPQSAITHAVGRAKAAGLATGLLSNSWGNEYPRDGWEVLFDVVVISGEVNMRKPDPEIFRLTAERLQLEPAQCVFVDDLLPNIRGAATVGMVGVHHVTAEQTIDELEALLGIALRP